MVKATRQDLPPSSELQKLIKYDAETGKMYWLPREASMFPAVRNARMWNTRFAGKRALDVQHHAGYLYGELLGRPYLAHRIIWYLVHSEMPDEIDHINGDRTDNRLVNLRSVTRKTNCENLARRFKNTSGVTGVCWDRDNKMWMVRIRKVFVGRFRSFDDAVAARKAAEKTHHFHENHGRKAVKET